MSTTTATGTPTGLVLGSTGLNYEAIQAPDLVANLRIDQAWGSVQIMGAFYNVATSATTSTRTIVLGANDGKPAGTYTIANQDLWAVRFRVNRRFYP